MTSRTVIAIAVASALGWPLAAAANSNMRSADTRDEARVTDQSHQGRFMHRDSAVNRGDVGTWEVATPYSPNEIGPVAWPGEDRTRSDQSARNEYESVAPVDVVEVMTPFSPDENGPAVRPQRRHDITLATARSLPNPQTPASPNESDNSRVLYDTMAYREQVAEIDRIHMSAASGVGTTPGTFEERAVSRSEPEAPAAVDTGPQAALRNDVTPAETATRSEESPPTEVMASESAPALTPSEHPIGLAPRDRRIDDTEAPSSLDAAQTEPLVPESGVATPPSQSAFDESERRGADAATM
ncbi:MAG TPA: hypothetical protein VLN59_06360 [Burkholderiales bacterium]|nr:hypothetical protein [Burkholderiales bacterium]